MKWLNRIAGGVLAVALVFPCAGCSTAPHGKPLSDMNESELIAYNQNAPMEKPAERGILFEDVMRTTAAVIIALPLAALYFLGASNAHFSTGK